MKRALLFIVAVTAMLAVRAGNAAYTYLTFEMTDGTKASVELTNLTLKVNGTTLTAGSQEFTLTNLTKMYFTADDQSTSGISTVIAADLDEATAVYDLKGCQVSKSQMRHGVYIVKTKQGTYKVNVK